MRGQSTRAWRERAKNWSMRLLYDTRNVHPLDGFDHYRSGAATELAPVEVSGPAPKRLVARMSGGPIGDFGFEELTWTADTEIVTVRTERLIRASDPEQYRLILVISGEIELEQRDHRTRSRRGDIGLFDLSLPWRAAHPPETGLMRIAMLTFPRTLLPVDERRLRPIIGTFMPRRLPGSDLMRQLLGGLADTIEPADYADVLAECTAGLISQRLGLPDGVSATHPKAAVPGPDPPGHPGQAWRLRARSGQHRPRRQHFAPVPAQAL